MSKKRRYVDVTTRLRIDLTDDIDDQSVLDAAGQAVEVAIRNCVDDDAFRAQGHAGLEMGDICSVSSELVEDDDDEEE